MTIITNKSNLVWSDIVTAIVRGKSLHVDVSEVVDEPELSEM